MTTTPARQPAIEDGIEAIASILPVMTVVIDRMLWGFATAFGPRRREVWATGLEGRYYVRGGLHPAHASEAGIVALAAAILNGTADPTCEAAPDDVRLRCAAAALRGWGDHRSPDTPVLLAWHRLIGGQAVTVGHSTVTG